MKIINLMKLKNLIDLFKRAFNLPKPPTLYDVQKENVRTFNMFLEKIIEIENRIKKLENDKRNKVSKQKRVGRHNKQKN